MVSRSGAKFPDINDQSFEEHSVSSIGCRAGVDAVLEHEAKEVAIGIGIQPVTDAQSPENNGIKKNLCTL